MMNIRKLTILALLTTIALTIFMIESVLPPLVPVPGVKLGLANIVTLFILTRFEFRDAAAVLFVRIIMASIFGGQIVYLLYSLAGGVFSLIVMAIISKILNRKYVFITGVFGAIAHNVGQIAAAFLILKLSGILVYVPFLMISGVITGLFTGFVCLFADKKIPAFEM